MTRRNYIPTIVLIALAELGFGSCMSKAQAKADILTLRTISSKPYDPMLMGSISDQQGCFGNWPYSGKNRAQRRRLNIAFFG